MKILALECSTTARSIAAMEDGVIHATRFEIGGQGPAERLTPMLIETMTACGWTHHDLHAYAVTTGPGRFTGLRVGLATAKALSLAAQKPLIGMSSLTTLVWPLFHRKEKPPGPVVCFLDSGRSDLYVQIFTTTLKPPGLRSISTITTYRPDMSADWIPQDAWAYGHSIEAVKAGLKGRTDVIFPDIVFPDRNGSQPGESKDALIHAQALAGLAQATYAGRRLPRDMPSLVYGRPHYAELSAKHPQTQPR